MRLTLAILLVLSAAAAFGTFLPRSQDPGAWQTMAGTRGAGAAAVLGLTDFYHSVWFTGLLAVLCANLLFCMADRLPGMLLALSGKNAVKMEPVVDLPDSEGSNTAVASALRSMGLKNRAGRGSGIYSRGIARYPCTVMTHASIVLIMLFSIFGSVYGFVATKRVHVGSTTETAYDWKVREDRKLPFSLRAEDLVIIPNPVALRIGVLNLDTQHHEKVITTHEGGTFRVPGIKGDVTVRSFDPGRKDFLASWTSPGGNEIEIRKDREIGNSGLSLNLLAFATWPERQVRAGVAVLHSDAEMQRGMISINHPMVADGIRIFLTDYGRDKFGFPYVGFQFVRDPGQAGVWIGSVIFLLCATGAILTRYTCAVVVRDGGRLKVHISATQNREMIIEQLNSKLHLMHSIADRGSGDA